MTICVVLTPEQIRAWSAEVEIRLQILEREGYLCECPDCKGGFFQPLPAHEVDHIKPKAWFKTGKAQGNSDHPGNLRVMNRECHKKLTKLQKGHRPAVRVGLDGFPEDE